MPRPRPAPGRTPAAPPRRRRRWWSRVGTGAAVMVSGAAGAPRPTGMGTHASSATPTATATAVATPPSARLPRAERRNRGGEAQRVLDETQGEHRQPAGEQGRCHPGGQPQRVAQQHRCEHQHRPVPQIPRVGDPADRPHRRQPQHAAASLSGCGTAGADHQRRTQHGQQRGDTRIERGRAQPGAGQQDQSQPGPSGDRGSSCAAVGATGRP